VSQALRRAIDTQAAPGSQGGVVSDEDQTPETRDDFAAVRSSIGDVFGLHTEIGNCYQRTVSSPVDKP